MKSKSWSQYIIALSVIGCSLILLATLTVAITGQRWGTYGRKLEIEFKDATGIKLHSSVRYAGAVAGSVVAIRYLTPEERAQPGKSNVAVRVTVRLVRRVPPLPKDVKVTISSETIMGEKFVALSAGTPGAEALPDGTILEGQSMMSFDSLFQTLDTTLAPAKEVLARFNGDYPELKTNLNLVLLNASAVLTKTTNLVGDAQTAMTNVTIVLSNANETLAGLRPAVTPSTTVFRRCTPTAGAPTSSTSTLLRQASTPLTTTLLFSGSVPDMRAYWKIWLPIFIATTQACVPPG